MKKKEFRERLKKLILGNVENISFDEKIVEAKKVILDLEKEHSEYDKSNKWKPWTDDELRLILSLSPTKENIIMLNKAFKRGYGSIEQIYRWASTDREVIKEKGRENDAFINQIKKIAKEIGWRAG